MSTESSIESKPRSDPLSRQCGDLEQFFVSQAKLGAAQSVAFAASYKGIELTDSVVYAALKYVIENLEPVLSINIFFDGKKKPFFKTMKEVDLTKAVEFQRDEEYSGEYVTGIFNSAEWAYADESQPLWKVIVLKNNTLLFWFEHTCYDGRSGSIFHRQFVKALRTVGKDASNVSIETVASPYRGLTEIPSPVEQLANVNTPTSILIKSIWAELLGTVGVHIPAPTDFKAPNFKRRFKTWNGPKENLDSKFENSNITFSVDSEIGTKLLLKSRSLGVTLTAVFFAALQHAIVATYSNVLTAKASHKKGITIKSDYPVDARPYFYKKTSGDVVGSYVFSLAYLSSLRLDEVVECRRSDKLNAQWASDFNKLLKQKREQEAIRDSSPLAWPMSMLKYVNGDKYAKQELNAKERSTLFEISNLGAVNFDNDGEEIIVDDAMFTQNPNRIFALYTLSVACVKGGNINFCMTSAADQTRCKEICERFVKILETAAESS